MLEDKILEEYKKAMKEKDSLKQQPLRIIENIILESELFGYLIPMVKECDRAMVG